MNGVMVNCYTEKCRSDISLRIEDAVFSRDTFDPRSDSRTYYNGILRVLRRKLREVEKELKKETLLEEQNDTSRASKERHDITIDQRILELSGLA